MNDLKRLLAALARPPRLDYYAMYPAVVLKDHGDFTLDVQPEDERLPGLTRIPMRVPFPGITAIKVKRGARVIMAFEHADPSRPYCDASYANGQIEKIEIQTSAGQKVLLDDLSGITLTSTLPITINSPMLRVGNAALLPVLHVNGPSTKLLVES